MQVVTHIHSSLNMVCFDCCFNELEVDNILEHPSSEENSSLDDNEALGHIPNVISCETQGAALRSESARLTFFLHPLIKHKKHLQNLQLQHSSWFFFYIGVTTKTKVHCTQGLYPISETNFQDSD